MNNMNNNLIDGVTTFHFDFNKNFNCPKLSCQQAYYASKLSTYSLGIYSSETKKTTTYIWPETIAPKHPDTLVSCLDHHLRIAEIPNHTWSIFYCDNTRSQNKNYTVAMYLDNLVASGFRKRIDLKFLIAGHSFGPVDRAAGRSEQILRRHQQIETPSDYVNIINHSTQHPNISWTEMPQDSFKCFSTWLRNRYIEHRKDTDGNPFLFSEMVHFNFGVGERVDPQDNIVKTYSHEGVVWMRRSLDPHEDPTVLDLRRKRGIRDLNVVNLNKLNNNLIEISAKKREDLRQLSRFLSPRGKLFYENISSG